MCVPELSSDNSPTSLRWASTGTDQWCISPIAPSCMTRRSPHWLAVGSSTSASARAERFSTHLQHPTNRLASIEATVDTLTDAERTERAAVRPPALRLRSNTSEFTVDDEIHGAYTGIVDDFVLRRGDGVVAYNLAVVVDDAQQGVDQVVRGDDLLPSAPRQAYLASLLGTTAPTYVHVPIALNSAGKRLAKRDGAVTYEQLRALGVDVLALIAGSLGLTGSTPAELLRTYDPAQLPREPWIFVPPT